jgi:hypothetical protein
MVKTSLNFASYGGTLDQFIQLCPEQRMIASAGCDLVTFRHVFLRYCGVDTPIKLPCQLYQLLVYMKIYPVQRNLPQVFGTDQVTGAALHHTISQRLEYLANSIDELAPVWTDRFNHPLPHYFSNMVTGSLDTFPIFIARPDDEELQRFAYNGKYAGHVLKVRPLCALNIINCAMCEFLLTVLCFIMLYVLRYNCW